MKKLQKYVLPTIIALAALSVSASAAFYSVSGLSKLFAGAALAVTIMAASLEVAKLVIASLLYQYWTTLNKGLRAYLTVAALVLVLITSMGIYGFLSAAYQDTYRMLSVKQNQTAFLTQKKDFYEKDVIRYDGELERISSNISTLSNAKSTAIQVKDTSVVGGIRTSISTAEIRLAQQRIRVEEENRKQVQAKREIAADSLQKYQLQILDLENNTEVAGELGPLQYLSGLTGAPMDKIINILLLVIIFVFDPLAISLVIAANFSFDQAKPKKNLYGEIEDDFSEWDDLDEEEEPNEDLRRAAIKYKEISRDDLVSEEEIMAELDPKEIEVIDPQVVNDKLSPEEEKQLLQELFEKQQETQPDPEPSPTPEPSPDLGEPIEKDWQVVDEDGKELPEQKKFKRVKKVLQRTPSKRRVLFTDGSEGWVAKTDNENKKYYM